MANVVIAEDRPKLIYVAHRHPRYSHDEFIRRWRQHGSLGMSQPRWRNVALYLHCDQVDGLTRSLPILECDGVAIVVYRSDQARQAHIADEGARRIMKADELETFAQPVATTSLLVRERVERHGPFAEFRLFVFWTISGAAEQARYGEPSLADTDVALTHNRPRDHAGSPLWARVDELTSASVETLDSVADEIYRDGPAVGGEPRFVLTRPVVLHDLPDLP